MMSDESDSATKGTARPAKIEKAGCGVRYSEDELREGIDFSRAAALKPDDDNEDKPGDTQSSDITP